MKRCKPAGWAGFYGFKNGAPLRIFLDRHSHIEQEARRYAEDELAEYARQAAQAIEHAEQRQGRESLLAVADTLAAIRDVLDKVPLSDLAIPVVTDIIFRAAQLLTLDLDLDEARAAHRQIVEAHVNATNPAHADYDALQQAGEARRRASGQAGEAVGGLLRLSFFAIGAAFGTAASGGARRREARVSQRTAKTSKAQPKKQSPPQRVVDNRKRIQENWTRGRAPKGIVTRSPKLQRWAQQGGYIDPRTNKWVPTSEKLAADHVYPKSLIEKLPRFEKLTRDQKDFLLNYPGNFEPLPKVWNSSKLNRLADDWAKTPMGRQASDEYIVRLRERQQAFEGFARELIQFWTD